MNSMSRFIWKVFLWVNWGVIIYFWWQGSGGAFQSGFPSILIALGKLAGLAATYTILQQFFFMGRFPWLERTFGLDRLTRLHHTNGKLGLLFLLIHPVLLTFGYALASHTGVISQYLTFLRDYEDVLNAFIGTILFTIIVVVSLSIVRLRLRYETWYVVHLINYAAILLVFSHQFSVGSDLLASTLFYWYFAALYIVVLGIHVFFRFFLPSYRFWKHRFYIDRVVRETQNVVSLYITGTDMSSFHAEPGQFMFLYIFAKGMWWQKHPFSVSMIPDGTHLRVTIKELGDYTRMVADLKPGTQLMIDGPYGIFTKRVLTQKKALLIAGGIGITPVRSVFEQLLRVGIDVVLLYGNRNSSEIVFQKELAAIGQARVVDVLSDDVTYTGEKGRIDEEKVVRLVPDFKERDIYICGPVPMMNGLLAMFKKLGVAESRLHYEKFEL